MTNKTANKIIYTMFTVAFVSFALFVVVVGAFTLSTQLNSTGTIIADGNLSITPASIDWGTLTTNGDTVTRQVTVTNNAGVPLTLTMMAPNLPTGLALSWDGNGELSIGAVKTVSFTLTTNGAQTGAFNIQITITGVQSNV